MNAGDCIHELNPAGGFERLHRRLCGYSLDCFADAAVHIQIVGQAWCGNVCRACAKKIGATHPTLVSEELRGLEEDDGRAQRLAGAGEHA